MGRFSGSRCKVLSNNNLTLAAALAVALAVGSRPFAPNSEPYGVTQDEGPETDPRRGPPVVARTWIDGRGLA
jgi:hypothetical protein